MPGDADLAAVAALIGERSRARMLAELLAGAGVRAGELAAAAGVSRPTASSHLAKLLAGGLVEVDVEGRHRVYRLAGPAVGEALEALGRLAPAQEVRSLRAANTAGALADARFCYDHLAGRLAIELVEAMTAARLLHPSTDCFEVTRRGERHLSDFGIDLDAARSKRRSFSRACLDWSERRPHLAGSLGAALAARLLELGWIERAPSGRAVKLTRRGRPGLRDAFGLRL